MAVWSLCIRKSVSLEEGTNFVHACKQFASASRGNALDLGMRNKMKMEYFSALCRLHILYIKTRNNVASRGRAGRGGGAY